MERNINTSFTIPISSLPISPDRSGLNYKRKAINIVNTSLLGEIVYISIGQEAIYGKGIALYPGGSYDKDLSDKPPQDQYNAIANVATATVAIYEELV